MGDEPKTPKEALARALAAFVTSEKGRGFLEQVKAQAEEQKRLGLTDEQYQTVFLAGAEGLQDRYSMANRRNASGSRQKQWAVELARQLVAEFQTFPEAWNAIPHEDECDFDERVTRSETEGGQVLRCEDDSGSPLSREAFRTGYFVKERNGKL